MQLKQNREYRNRWKEAVHRMGHEMWKKTECKCEFTKLTVPKTQRISRNTDTPQITQQWYYGNRRKSNSGQVETEYTRNQKYGYVKWSAVEIKPPTPWILISGSMTAPPPVLSPSRILQTPRSHCAFIRATKNSGRFSEMFFEFFVFLICVTWNCIRQDEPQWILRPAQQASP